ncbi:unnamed protein product, partial [Mesorhabditis belari]|uniref:Uncharacterized protein n=1 Tax=Mesorhabditis belari TaxID=2138241 RepID=A0AAF3F5R0_9BILA
MSLVKENGGGDSDPEARQPNSYESEEEIDDEEEEIDDEEGEIDDKEEQENDENNESKRREISFDKNPTMVSKYLREEVIDFLRKKDDQSVYVVQTKKGIKYELHVEMFQSLVTSVSREQAFLVSAMKKSCVEYFGGRIVDVGMQDIRKQFLRYYVQKKNETSVDLDTMLHMLVDRGGTPDIGFVKWVLSEIVKVLTYAYHCGCVVENLEVTMFAYDPVRKVLRLKDLSSIATKGFVFPASEPTNRVRTKEEQFEQGFVQLYVNSVRLVWQEMFRLANGYNVSSDIIGRTFKAVDKMVKQNLKQVDDLRVMDPKVAEIMHPWLFQILVVIQKATSSVEKLINNMSGVTQRALFDILKPIFTEVGLAESIDAAEKTNLDEAMERARDEQMRTAQLESIDEHRKKCLMHEYGNRLKRLSENNRLSDEYMEKAKADRGPFDVPLEKLSIAEAKHPYFTYASQEKKKSKKKHVDDTKSEEKMEESDEDAYEDEDVYEVEDDNSFETESDLDEPATKIKS